ncbi:MAG: hypothetical protein FJ404_01365 [Verrucomicrobia bacterium]|nr:hypothetical protein [Verrucomicrobiota bacterium]
MRLAAPRLHRVVVERVAMRPCLWPVWFWVAACMAGPLQADSAWKVASGNLPAASLSQPAAFRPSWGPAPRWPVGTGPSFHSRGGRALPAEGFSLSTMDREQVRVFFAAVFSASEGVDMGWTGFHSTGDPGMTNPDFKEAVRRRINFFRAMAGVPAGIRFSDTFNRKCQQSALMMSANNDLSHTSPPQWRFWTEEGSEAARNGNLALGSAGPDAIVGLMRDNGGNNTAAGHRRWFLFPETQIMGTGDVPRVDAHPPANVTWVFPDSDTSLQPVSVRDEFVAWPPPGFVPYPVIYPRWSFGLRDAAFRGATVTMTRSGTNIPVRLEAVQDGFGDNAIVWIADNQPTDTFLSSAWPKPAKEEPIRVVVANVRLNGQVRRFEYFVTPMDPAMKTPGAPEASITGPQEMSPQMRGNFQIQTLVQATGYEWRSGSLHPAELEGAEKGLGEFQTRTSPGYAVIDSGSRRTGSAGFHLVMPDFASQFLTWKKEFLLLPGAKLRLQSRLGIATPDQSARVEVSSDAGASWSVIYRQAGADIPGERSFVLREIDLTPWVGMVVQFRFSYFFEEGNAYFDTDSNLGWSLDDLQVVQGLALSGLQVFPAAAGGTFQASFSEAGERLLQARGFLFGGFPGEWGPPHRLMVRTSSRIEIRSIVRSTDGRIRVRAAGPAAGSTVILQRSEDLLTWSEASRGGGNGGEIELADDSAGPVRLRFYRLLLP